MTIVSSREFSSNQERYFDLALNEDIAIKRGKNMFHLIYASEEKTYPEQQILEPDEDFHRALSADEFKKRLIVVLDKVDKKYASKCK